MENVEIEFAGDSAILIKLGESISPGVQALVQQAFLGLVSNKPAFLRSIHPAYNSILVTFDLARVSPLEFRREIERVLARMGELEKPEPRTVEIPVCYEKEFGPDLEDVAGLSRLSVPEVIRLHTRDRYLVYFLGFSPGFPYLGGMPDEIAVPRLPTPRLKVAAGSVAIGGRQTGVYPVASPGGWRIIGRTPIKLFSPNASDPTLFKMGDLVQFSPISSHDFEKISRDLRP